MQITHIALLALLAAPAAFSQAPSLTPGTTLPITFDRTIDAAHAHAGDPVSARRTTQPVSLANGSVLPSGARVLGHIVTASAFHFNPTHYAIQTPASLAIQFDAVEANGTRIPLSVSLRAMADPTTVWAAARPQSTDLDPLGTTTQIGGDQVVPSQEEVRTPEGDIVGYKHRGGVYAHLLAASGGCDATQTEQPVGVFSANACGLYGFTGLALTQADQTSTLTLFSTHLSPKIWAHSSALLEAVAPTSTVASR